MVHRPFIPIPQKISPFAYPSLSICANAARSCIHLINNGENNNIMWLGHVQAAMFTSGLVLLLNTWSGKRSGFDHNARREWDDISKCFSMFKALEKRWHSAGRIWDILTRLASAGDLPLAQLTSPLHKRRRDYEVPASIDSSTSASPSTSTPSSDEVTPAVTYLTQSKGHQLSQSSNFALPYSSDLARLPVYYEPSNARRNFTSQPQQNTQWFTSSYLPSNELPRRSIHLGDPVIPSGATFSNGSPPNNQLASFTGGSVQTNHGLGSLYLEQFHPIDPNPPDQGPMMDSDTLAIWSNAPPGLDTDAWENYISSFDMVTHFTGAESS